MARPSVPLIDPDEVCKIALEMIDDDGIEAMTVRRLADRIGVNAASLYHHFDNKDAIIAGAAQLALDETRTERVDDEDWRSWCLRNAERLYAILTEHPALVPVLLKRNAFELNYPNIEFFFGEFERRGLAIGLGWPLLESLQAFTIGMVMQQEASRGIKVRVKGFPNIQRATKGRVLTHEEQYRRGCRALIDDFAIQSDPPARAGEEVPRHAERAVSDDVSGLDGEATKNSPRRRAATKSKS